MASRSLGTLTLDLIARIGGFQQGMDQAARSAQRSMSQVERQAQQTSQSVMTSFKGIAGAAAAYLSAQQVIEYSQTWISVQNRIKQVSETFDQFSKQSLAVFQVAQNSQAGLEATAELYQRIAASSGQLGATQEKVAQVTQNISKAMSASGVSAEAAKGALVQLGQAFASGVLRGQELNSVLEQAPGLAQAIADGLGVARESLRSMGEAGKLTSKEVFAAILDQTRSIDDAFSRSQTTISGAFQAMENSAARFFGTLDETYGITKSFVQSVLSLSAAWDSSSVQAFTQVLTTGLYVALARVAAGFVSATGAKYLDIKATQEQLHASSLAAAGELRRAEAVKIGAVADVEAAARAVAGAKAKVSADRQVLTSEMGRLQAVQSALAAEKMLEAQRLQAQITEVGRQQSVARMVELRLAEVAITNQLSAAETKLAATTLASSAQVTAAINQQTVAKEALAIANTQVATTQAAATASMGAWFSASTAMGASMVALRSAGASVMRMAAGWPGLILMVGALALSFIDFGDKAEDGAGKAANAFEDASTRIRQASRSMLPENISSQTYEQLQDRLKELQAELKETEKVQERFQKGVDDKTDVPMEASLDASKEKADALKLAIQEVNKELNGARLSSNKDGGNYLKNLEKQAVVAGKLTEVEKLRAQIAAGSLKFAPDDEKKALAAAAAIDKANAALKASKASDKDDKTISKRFEQMEEGYQRQIELINTSTDKRKNATEAEKLAFEASSGKLEELNEKQRKRLEGLAAELDAKKQLKQAEEDANKLAAFRSSVDEDYLTAKNGFDQELAGAGMGDKYRDRLKERLAIEQDFNRQQRELVLQRNSGDISPELYEKETRLLSAALDRRMALQADYYDAVDQAQSDWASGVSDAWQNYADQAKDVAGQMRDAFATLFDGLTDAAVEWAFGADQTFGEVALSFAKMVAKMAMQAAASNVFTSIFGTLATGLAGAGAASAGAAGGGFDYGLGSASAGMSYTPAGFSSGGFTGTGGKHDPAGIVHAGEFVLRKEIVEQPGMRAYLERLNSNGRGYADGGYVTPATGPAAGASPVVIQQQITVDGSGGQSNAATGDMSAVAQAYAKAAQDGARQEITRQLGRGGMIWTAINRPVR